MRTALPVGSTGTSARTPPRPRVSSGIGMSANADRITAISNTGTPPASGSRHSVTPICEATVTATAPTASAPSARTPHPKAWTKATCPTSWVNCGIST